MNKNNRLRQIIMETVRQTLMEGGMFKDTATPLIHIPTVGDERGNHNRNLDKHPDETDSQITRDEEGFKTDKDEHFVVSDSRFTFYKVKNFGNPNIKDTLSLFGGGAQGETELKKAIHTVNGAAKRNGKYLRYRTITSESNQAMSERTDHMRGTFWEFSYGGDWFILKPHPVQNLKISTFNPNPKPINQI